MINNWGKGNTTLITWFHIISHVLSYSLFS